MTRSEGINGDRIVRKVYHFREAEWDAPASIHARSNSIAGQCQVGS